MTYQDAIATAILDLMRRDPRVLILGAGVADPKASSVHAYLHARRIPTE